MTLKNFIIEKQNELLHILEQTIKEIIIKIAQSEFNREEEFNIKN